MGARSSCETVVKLVRAFEEQAIWQQADLARVCEVSSRQVGKVLLEMTRAGFGIVRDDSCPPYVYWRKRKPIRMYPCTSFENRASCV